MDSDLREFRRGANLELVNLLSLKEVEVNIKQLTADKEFQHYL